MASKIANCVTCLKQGAVQEQKMSDLPEDYLEPATPFIYCAVDYCGPWYIKEGHKEVKKYRIYSPISRDPKFFHVSSCCIEINTKHSAISRDLIIAKYSTRVVN